MLTPTELFHKYLIDKISTKEKNELQKQLKKDPVLIEEFTLLKALKKAARRNLLMSKMAYLKHIDKTMDEKDKPAQNNVKFFTLIRHFLKCCA